MGFVVGVSGTDGFTRKRKPDTPVAHRVMDGDTTSSQSVTPIAWHTVIVNTARMKFVTLLVSALLFVAACQTEPQDLEVQGVGVESIWLGLPDRVGDSGQDDVLAPTLIPLGTRLRADSVIVQQQSPDSLTVVMHGQPARVEAELPALMARDLAAVRLSYRGTLGGELGLSWREGGEEQFRPSTGRCEVPGAARLVSQELGFGPTRVLGPRIATVAIDLPGGEVGTVSLQDVNLVLRPGQVLHHADLGGVVREVLAPGPLRWLEWDVVVPMGARLQFDYGTHARMQVSHGDGTRFIAEIVDGRETTRVCDEWRSAFAVPEHRGWQCASADLTRWGGQRVTLRLLTEPGPAAHGIFPGTADPDDDDPLFTVPRLIADHDPRPDILLIVIDTLRKDAVGVWGSGPTPTLDSLAAAGIRFDRATAPGSWTQPSVGGILSGWSPARHGLGYGPAGATRLHPQTPLVARELRDAGWATAAVSNNAIVSVEEGLADGFVSFDQRPFVEDQVYGAQRVTRYALEWLDEHPDGPRFLYLHYFDPHDRYQAPPPFTRAQVDPRLEARIRDSSVRAGQPNHFMPELNDEARDLRPDELAYMQGLYRGEVQYVDHWIGRLLAGLRTAGALDNTLVLVTADHGEEFLDHGGLKHGHTVYEELVAVPLIVGLPGGARAGTVVAEPVSLLAIAPTLRAVAGLATLPGARLWGTGNKGVRPLVENWAWGEGPRAGPQRALIDGPLKLIEYAAAGRSELFDLDHDPHETTALADQGPAGPMRAVLDSLAGATEEWSVPGTVDPALFEKLKAMGYVH